MTVAEEFGRRAARADALAAEGGAAVPLLRFAGELLRAQGRVASALAAGGPPPLSGSIAADLPRLLPLQRAFLELLRRSSAPEVAEEAGRLLEGGDEEGRRRLLASWSAEASGASDFLSRAFLRPCLETLRAAGHRPDRPPSDTGCPFCGGPPGVGFLRVEAETHGAGRHLVCSFCGGERALERIRCPGCGETDPAKLPVFRSERHPGVRLEACEACRRYVKAIDLGVDARPLPEVDDLLSVALDLWAQEEGWERLEPGIAGV